MTLLHSSNRLRIFAAAELVLSLVFQPLLLALFLCTADCRAPAAAAVGWVADVQLLHELFAVRSASCTRCHPRFAAVLLRRIALLEDVSFVVIIHRICTG